MQNSAQITLAVFPFEDLSVNKDLGIFCRSFSEDLIIELSRFRQLQLIRLPDNINEYQNYINQLLNEGYYVQGMFSSDNDSIRISVKLYAGENQHLIWGNRYEGKLIEMNEIQENLLGGIVAILQQQINIDLISRLRKRQKISFTAYEYWLNGMEELKRGSLESDLKARAYFSKAIENEPDYALAYMGMSLSYFNEWSCQLWDRWEVSKTGAFEWAQKAVQLDEQNHIIAVVLGRIFLYEGSYNTAEYYFRKSLMLNMNDPETLFMIALYLVYLGYNKEALEICDKGLKLNPFGTGSLFRLVGVIYFEMSEYEKAASQILDNMPDRYNIADTEAYCAAVYYYLHDYDKMKVYWNRFLEKYNKIISKGNSFTETDAINWLLKLNPHRYKTNLEEFLRYISKGTFENYPLQKTFPEKEQVQSNLFIRESASWKISFYDKAIQVPEVKGFYDLQKLLVNPNQFIHCAELMGGITDTKGEKVIDEKARKNYQKKITDLQTEIEEAEQFNDFSRSVKLQEEYETLVVYLTKSLNIRGGSRETGNSIEKARSAVTWRIRNAIARIEQYHPIMGAHLANSIKTGTLCTYKPERKISWITQ